jgi:hypothetical protein
VKVYVVVSDCGLSGPDVHGVFTSPPSTAEIEEFVLSERVTADGFHYRVAGVTGYQNTKVIPMELDGPLS